MGLVATMSALVLGLLVTSVKGAYDTRKGEVIQMAAKVAFIDRVLKAYGPEADEVRRQFREVVEEDTRRLWPRGDDIPAQFRPNGEGGDSVFIADQLQRLVPRDDTQRSLKTQATSLVMEFRQLRSNADCPVGGLHFKADAHCGDLLVHAHFPEFQPARPV